MEIVVLKLSYKNRIRKWMKCDPESYDYIAKTAELEHAMQASVNERMDI
jgi:hypothetical protein